MLREVRIRNVAVIESATVPFGPGLNVLTGETGAGKSILIDAILLVAGGRGQLDVIRSDADAATVEAVFEIAAGGGAAVVLEEAGLRAEDGQVVIRRELARSGRHRAFINDSPVTVGLLQRLGEHLVEVHGQHEHQRLLERERQLDLLDAFAGAEALAARVAELHGRWRAAAAEVEQLQHAERERAQREDLLRFQVQELEAARLHPGEAEALRAERRRLQHAQRLLAGLADAGALLVEDRDGAAARLARAARLLRDLGRLDPALGAPADMLDTAAAHVEEAVAALRELRASIEAEPERLLAIDERLDALGRLERKYGEGEAAMLAFLEAARRELTTLEQYEALLADATQRLAALRSELDAAAAALGESRLAAAARLGPLVQRELRALGLERARFEALVESLGAGAVSARGSERVEFRFSANPGQELRPLARVASGGELSRVMLGLQAVLATADPVPTAVFDEVDAGVGGHLATVVADRLARAARSRQVLCVTHLAPIAARADHHLRVVKTVRGGRTRALVTALSAAERVDEIGRMLGGEALTPTARRHARELLGRG